MKNVYSAFMATAVVARTLHLFSLVIYGIMWSLCEAPAQTITRDEYLRRLLGTHPMPQKERLTSRIEKKAQEGYVGAQDWLLFSQVGVTHEEPALSFAGPERTNSLAITAGAERAIWETGGRLKLSVLSTGARIQPTFGFDMPLYQNAVALSYVHPLLRNSRGALDRLEHDLKGFDVDAAGIQADENIETFLAASAKMFLLWSYLTEQEKIVAERLKLSRGERDRALEKRKANLVDQADVIRAEDAVRSWKQQQAQVVSERNALRAQLAVLADFPQLNEMSPQFDLYKTEQIMPFEEASARLRSKSRLLKVLDLRRQQLEMGRGGFEEVLKPDLSLYGNANTKRLDERFGKSLEMDKPDFGVGVRISLPLGNTTARTNIERTEVQIVQVAKHRDEAITALTASLANLHVRLEELQKILVLNEEQIESARQRTDEDLKLYNQGRGELAFVLLSRDNEQNARTTYAQNAFTYHTLLLEYSELMDDLFEGEVN